MRILTILTLLSISIIGEAALPGLAASLNNVIDDRNIGIALISSNGDTLTVGSEGCFDLASVECCRHTI